MKKIFYLICALFILTGCEATYTINIDDDFNESLVLTSKNSSELSEMNSGAYLYPAIYDSNFSESNDLEITSSSSYDDDSDGIDVDFEEEYDDEDDDDETLEEDKDIAFDEDDPYAEERYELIMNNNSLIYSYRFKDRYQDSHIALSSVDDFEAINSFSDVYPSSISASDFSYIFDEYAGLTKLTINVVTNKKVVSSNADSVKGNVYTWVITKKNANRRIQIYFIDERYYDYVTPIYDYISNNNSNNNSSNSNSGSNNGSNAGINNGSNNGSSNNPNGSSNNGSNNGSANDPNSSSNNGSNNGSSDDPNGTSNNGANNNSNSSKNNDNSTSKNSKKSKQSKVILYVLYSLFFGLIFGIMIVRTIKEYKKK